MNEKSSGVKCGNPSDERGGRGGSRRLGRGTIVGAKPSWEFKLPFPPPLPPPRSPGCSQRTLPSPSGDAVALWEDIPYILVLPFTVTAFYPVYTPQHLE